jgi:hypothetical protein
MALRLPTGPEIFGKLIEKQLDFVDKTLLIKEVLDDVSNDVIIFTRPRRFGKTLNLSMLHHFFAPQAFMYKTQGMFDRFKIAQLGDAYMRHQGQYPVIFMTLKDISNRNFAVSHENVSQLLANLYEQHRMLLDSNILSPEQQVIYRRILCKEGNETELREALKNLIEYLHHYHQQKVWLLIDEYDTPIQSSYVHGYYDDMINLMRGILGTALKTSPYLEKAVITGILRVAKESLFSDVNNVKVYGLLDTNYGEYFGFTEEEVTDLFHRADLDRDANKIRNWYNGYRCGDTVIYNPWSIVRCIDAKGELVPYWLNTSGNDLVKTLFAQGDEVLKAKLEALIAGQSVTAAINPGMVFGDLQRDQHAVWSLLLFSGYLKAVNSYLNEEDGSVITTLLVPNHEVMILYRSMIKHWITEPFGPENYQRLLDSLLRGDLEEFRPRFEDCLTLAFSIFDVTGQHPEKFYHGFVLGLVVSLADRYEVKSNPESGYGRANVMLIPKDKTQLGLVLEFKTLRDKNVDLTEGANQALQQILERRYADTLRAQGITRVLHLGLAFRGKEVAMVAS